MFATAIGTFLLPGVVEPMLVPRFRMHASRFSKPSNIVHSASVVVGDKGKAASNDFSASADQRQQQIAIGRESFERYFDFPLDDWQLEAGGAICQGSNVIVCAPTGAGKTVVGEMALLHAYHHTDAYSGIYTTPLKALSNQKYAELTQTFGRCDMGLSTGDMSINKGARITVMTTEVYRNIAWRSSTPTDSGLGGNADELIDNAVVVLDEFHYMGHPGRGGVWEECIITSPPHTQIVGLSATLSNAQALSAWMESVTNRTTVLVQVPGSERPVPLRYLFATKDGLFPLFRDPDAGPGAPKGLLGYRGDGDIEASNPFRHKKTGGFGVSASENAEKLPRGLQPNPVLKAEAAKRLQRVQFNWEKQMMRGRRGQGESRGIVDTDGGTRRRRSDDYQPPRRLSPRDERKEKERLLRSEMRRAVPAIHMVINKLKQRNLLPAIFFIFSRAGCDEAARNLHYYMKGPRDFAGVIDGEKMNGEGSRHRRTKHQRVRRRGEMLQDEAGRTFRPGSNYISEEVLPSLFDSEAPMLDESDFDENSLLSANNWKYYAATGLLEYDQVREVASRITVFQKQNEEIAFDDEIVEQYLFGIGSHHAGMLPAHKSFVELLYRNQLMLVVFATETLAAGINMPARTTVVCSMAKRGDGSSMDLLETSNLLQMAGRAGRRGMDTDGTCVIVATPFESHDDAAKILTDPIKPISSQFSPSYALAINLVARGEGKLDVARQLVSKSFAMWEKQVEIKGSNSVENCAEGVNEVVQASAQAQFVGELVNALEDNVGKQHSKFDQTRGKALVEIFGDRELLKKTSKAFIGAEKALKLEETTLRYLEREYESMKALDVEQKDDLIGDMLAEDARDVLSQIDTQRKRIATTEKDILKHPFTAIAAIANEIMAETTPQAALLRNALDTSRSGSSAYVESSELTPGELSTLAKSAVVVLRKTRVLAKIRGLDPRVLVDQADKSEVREDSWNDMLSIVRTLIAYGCLSSENALDEKTDLENVTFNVTQAGLNVGMLMFENSLWALVALGGAWDVSEASSKLDQFRSAMDAFDDYKNYDPVSSTGSSESSVSASQEEAHDLVGLLCSLQPHELAGYVSTLVADNSRGSGLSVVDSFQRLTPRQQRVIQKSLFVMERIAEVQKRYSIDENTRICPLYVFAKTSVATTRTLFFSCRSTFATSTLPEISPTAR
jgi:superfamily II RNA helicase